MLKIGSVVDGKYKILNIAGKGGMSIVYLAINEKANKQWAIKEIIKKDYRGFDMDKKEIEMMKRLKHPNLPAIVDVIEQSDSLLIVMDYIEGRSLEDIVLEYGPQNEKLVVHWAKQLCDVLHYLHTRTPPIIYRDMKPSNVMIKPDGNVMLIDFGAAREFKATNMKDTVLLGTKGYAAPEQYRLDGQSDARTDIYSLGVTIFRLLTGETPESLCSVRKIQPEISVGIENILLKCTRTAKQERYQSASALYEAFTRYWEFDENFRQEQKKKLLTFLFPFLLCLAFAAGTLWCSFREKSIRNHNYQAYLTAAQNSLEKEEAMANFKRAISLAPHMEDAYLQLLEAVFLEDGMFSAKESEKMREILMMYDESGTTNEQKFRKNQSGYALFSYEMGIVYFYKYEDKSNKKTARVYFEVAKESEALEEKKRMRAERLFLISDYYSKIGIVDEAGDVQVSYMDYWEDLKAASLGNLVKEDNERTAVVMYEELIGQIITNTVDFQSAGVKEQEILELIKTVESHLQSDFSNLEDRRKLAIKSELFKLQQNLKKAKKMVESVYGQTDR